MAIADLTGTTWRLNNTLRFFDGGHDFSSEYSNGSLQRGYYLDFSYSLQGDDYTATKLFCNYFQGKYHLNIYRTDSSGSTGWRIPYSGQNTSSLTANSDLYTDWTITITGGADATDAVLIGWLETNATLIAVATKDPTEITYNGATTSVEAGKTATLSCNGKRMKTDIVLAFGSPGSIAYNGTETAVDAGQTATLICAGKRMKTDVVVSL